MDQNSTDKQDERTPGPWHVEACTDYSYGVFDAKGAPVATALSRGNAHAIVKACNGHDKLREALAKLLTTAQLLLQNAEACAMNHHWRDFQEFGPPGWLADCENEILAARAALNGVTQPATGVEKLSTDTEVLK